MCVILSPLPSKLCNLTAEVFIHTPHLAAAGGLSVCVSICLPTRPLHVPDPRDGSAFSSTVCQRNSESWWHFRREAQGERWCPQSVVAVTRVVPDSLILKWTSFFFYMLIFTTLGYVLNSMCLFNMIPFFTWELVIKSAFTDNVILESKKCAYSNNLSFWSIKGSPRRCL